MYAHPNSVGYNAYDQMPEIFIENGIDFTHFTVTLGIYKQNRANDYFEAGSFLFGSQATRDINMLFSAIQRCSGDEHKDFQAYISAKRVRIKLLGISDSKAMGTALEAIANEYNTKYGMRHQIHDFYLKFIDDDSRATLLSGIAMPAHFYATFSSDPDTNLKRRLDFLLELRNNHDHAATYHPLALSERQPEYIHKYKDGKEYTFFVRLTFQQLYELTRKTMASYWLHEYQTALKHVGKERVEKAIDSMNEEYARLKESMDEQI